MGIVVSGNKVNYTFTRCLEAMTVYCNVEARHGVWHEKVIVISNKYKPLLNTNLPQNCTFSQLWHLLKSPEIQSLPFAKGYDSAHFIHSQLGQLLHVPCQSEGTQLVAIYHKPQIEKKELLSTPVHVSHHHHALKNHPWAFTKWPCNKQSREVSYDQIGWGQVTFTILLNKYLPSYSCTHNTAQIVNCGWGWGLFHHQGTR